MAKILFVYPNDVFEGVLPLPISILSAELKKAGNQVKLFDAIVYETETDTDFGIKHLEYKKVEGKRFEKKNTNMFEDLNEMIEEFRPDIIAVSATTYMFSLGLQLVKAIRNSDALVVFGGAHATVISERVIKEDCVDIVCIGEGDEALVELCDAVDKGKDFTKIENLLVKKNGKVYKNKLRPLIEDLDKLPFPDWSVFDEMCFYKPFVGKLYKTGHFEASRGCPYDCSYCSNSYFKKLFRNYGRHHREKSLSRVFAELRHFKRKYGLEMIKFWDESFLAMSADRLLAFVKRYKKEIGLPFMCQTRPETVSEEKIGLLKEAGCVAISMGIECGNEEFRRNVLNRVVSNEAILEAYRIINAAGIRSAAFNMIGLPFETRADIFETIELNRRVNPAAAEIGFFYPFIGTKLYDTCLKEGFFSDEYEGKANVREGSVLKMPQISKKEIEGIGKTFGLYVKANKLLFPLIRLCELENRFSNRLFGFLTNHYYKKTYGV